MGPSESRAPVALLTQFWEYARVVLPASRYDHVVEKCRAIAPTAIPGRFQYTAYDGAAFCAVICEGARIEGVGFARRAGFYAGSAIARQFVQASAHPSQSADRVTLSLAGAITGGTVRGKAGAAGRFEVRVESPRPIDERAVAYLAGFVKGACSRLNEGEPPAILAESTNGRRVWVATVEFSPRAADALTGARKTPR